MITAKQLLEWDALVNRMPHGPERRAEMLAAAWEAFPLLIAEVRRLQTDQRDPYVFDRTMGFSVDVEAPSLAVDVTGLTLLQPARGTVLRYSLRRDNGEDRSCLYMSVEFIDDAAAASIAPGDPMSFVIWTDVSKLETTGSATARSGSCVDFICEPMRETWRNPMCHAEDA
ncbi:MAG TPA: hypothetical protein VFB99_07855 [Vicinamibacterales bacterium]|nr:hypothetical protein [Vicinamibacterales bacterium]